MTAVAGWITAISVMIIAVALTFGVAAVAIVIRNSVARLLKAADPAIKRAEATLDTVGGIANTVKTRTDEISHTVEDTLDDVSHKVKKTTSVIEDAVTPPLIDVASMLAGMSRGLQVWKELSKKGGNSHEDQ